MKLFQVSHFLNEDKSDFETNSCLAFFLIYMKCEETIKRFQIYSQS